MEQWPGCVWRCLALSRITAAVAAAIVAAAAPPPPDLSAVPPDFNAVQIAAQQIRVSGCITAPCRAMLQIGQVLQIDSATEGAVTVGLPRPIPPNRDALAAQALDRLLLGHPRQFDAVCDGAAVLLAHVSLPVADPYVPIKLLLLGLDMDRRHGHCLPRLLAALPRNEAAAVLMDGVRRSCEARLHPSTTCGALTRH